MAAARAARAREPTGALACLPAYAAAGAGGVAGKPRETQAANGGGRLACCVFASVLASRPFD